jgi:hypothetical protein
VGLLTFILGGSELIGLVFVTLARRGGGTSGASVFGFIWVSLWIYGLLDAPLRAQKLSQQERGGLL